MTCLTEGNLEFRFDSDAAHCDEWAFYRNQFQNVAGGSKAVDFICLDGVGTWLIEVKDYRVHPRVKPSCLCDEVAIKVRDTIAGIAAARCNANDPDEKEVAKRVLRKNKWLIVLHLEQPGFRSRIRPRVIARADVVQKLKRLLKAIDAHPKVVDKDCIAGNMCWTVVSLPVVSAP
ncbi:MAG: hypothetical protein OXP69_12940 [Spirochaetaceae bacterium]|nr:hypothetical protein [Spirochaetaceae bacterium]